MLYFFEFGCTFLFLDAPGSTGARGQAAPAMLEASGSEPVQLVDGLFPCDESPTRGSRCLSGRRLYEILPNQEGIHRFVLFPAWGPLKLADIKPKRVTLRKMRNVVAVWRRRFDNTRTFMC